MPYFTHGETKNKLILLYAADHAAALPTREQLYRTAILNSEMEYFAFEEALGELLEDGLLTEVPKPFGAGLGLTDLGREALSLFEKGRILPASIYILASVILCIFGVFAGRALAMRCIN